MALLAACVLVINHNIQNKAVRLPDIFYSFVDAHNQYISHIRHSITGRCKHDMYCRIEKLLYVYHAMNDC